jgi:hypothetical protein
VRSGFGGDPASCLFRSEARHHHLFALRVSGDPCIELIA